MIYPLVDQEGRTITAARLMAAGALWARLVLVSGPDGYMYVQIGDYIPSLDRPYLSAVRVICKLVDTVRALRGVKVVCE